MKTDANKRKELALVLHPGGHVDLLLIADLKSAIGNVVKGTVAKAWAEELPCTDTLVVFYDKDGQAAGKAHNPLASEICGEAIYGVSLLLKVEAAGSVFHPAPLLLAEAESIARFLALIKAHLEDEDDSLRIEEVA